MNITILSFNTASGNKVHATIKPLAKTALSCFNTASGNKVHATFMKLENIMTDLFQYRKR